MIASHQYCTRQHTLAERALMERGGAPSSVMAGGSGRTPPISVSSRLMMNKKKPNDVTGLLSDRDSEIHWVEFAGKFRAGGLDFKRERLPLPADGMVQHWLSVQHIPNLQGEKARKCRGIGTGVHGTRVYTHECVQSDGSLRASTWCVWGLSHWTERFQNV